MQNILATIVQSDTNQASQSLYASNNSIWRTMSDALHESIYRVLSLLISILPGILAFIVALALLSLVGLALSAMLRHALTAAKFDDRLARSRGNAEWALSSSPTALIARASFWGCVLIGLVIGVSAFDASYATAAALPSSLLPYLARIVGAAFLLIAGNLSARFLARSVLVLTGAMVLDHLQIGGNVVELAFGILFGGIVLTLALAVGLGSRDLVSRSLESHAEHSSEHSVKPPVAPTTGPDESIRHF